MKIYISGPMTGYPEHNFPEFNRIADKIREMGEAHAVVNPAELDKQETPARLKEMAWEDYMRRDIAALCDCDAIVMHGDWRSSRGAKMEAYVAGLLGLPFLDEDLEPMEQETILEEAQRLIYGDRQGDYGHPIEDFTRTGRIWGAILGTEDVHPRLVALCMVGVKISREVNHPKRDNRTDGAGYFGCTDMVMQKLQEDPEIWERLRRVIVDEVNED